MEFLFEFLAEFWLEIITASGEALVADKRQLSKRQKKWLRFFSAELAVTMLLCLVMGIAVLCEDGWTTLSMILLAIGGGLLLLWLVLIVVTLYLRHRRRRKVAPTNNDTPAESV